MQASTTRKFMDVDLSDLAQWLSSTQRLGRSCRVKLRVRTCLGSWASKWKNPPCQPSGNLASFIQIHVTHRDYIDRCCISGWKQGILEVSADEYLTRWFWHVLMLSVLVEWSQFSLDQYNMWCWWFVWIDVVFVHALVSMFCIWCFRWRNERIGNCGMWKCRACDNDVNLESRNEFCSRGEVSIFDKLVICVFENEQAN